ncbi:hypothetical protein CALVIDRAFT_93625 [Calocera viscosa TUFC12733]|uniref:Uncharacterized protein n=1 Tax=Calocera viscosa (strain TUFC12733) TaxID=1330018 RepID=A0A167MVZ1_CALVF|nr:hypothetical protein CALVIDRAFT_93625 [Calocera viscosa TUFC12733]
MTSTFTRGKSTVRLLGLPSPPATNSDTSAGSTRVRQKELDSMNRVVQGESTPPELAEEMEEHTPRAEGREWIDEKAPVLERTLSLKSRSEDVRRLLSCCVLYLMCEQVLERMKSLRLSRSAAPTPAPEDDPSSPPTPAHSLLRMRSVTFGSYDDEPPPTFSRRTSTARPRLDIALSSSVSGSETEREPLPLHRRGSSTASFINGSVAALDEDDHTILAGNLGAFTAPRRQSADPGPRSVSVIGMSGSGRSKGSESGASGSGGGTTRAKVSPKVRKGLPVEFRRPSDEVGTCLGRVASFTDLIWQASPVFPEVAVTPATLSRNTSFASTSSTMRRRERETSITSDASFRSPSRAAERAAARRSMTSQPESSMVLDDSPSSRTVLIYEDRPPNRTSSMRQPRRPGPLTVRKEESSPLTAGAQSPRTPGGSRPRTLLGQELRAAGITSRRKLSDPPEETAAPVYAARKRFDSGSTREPYTPLASRLTERERERLPLSAPRAQTSMSGSWRDRERQREHEMMRTDPMPNRSTMRQADPDRSQLAMSYERPASVADWRAPTPDQERLNEPEHVRILWDALHTFGTNLGRVEGSDDGSGIGSGESRASVHGVTAVLGSARSAVAAVAGLGDSVRHGVARGMQRVVQAELEEDGVEEDVDKWKEELKQWRQAGKEVDEAVRALTGLMLGVGRVVRDAGLGEGSLTSRRSVDGAGVRRWSAAADPDGSATERERRPPLPSLQAHDTPPPNSRLALRKRSTMAIPTSAGHAHSASLEYETPSPLSRHTSLRIRQPPRPQLPALPSESNLPRPATIRGERKVSSASTASNSTLRGTRSSTSPVAGPATPLTPGGSRGSLKDRLTNFPALSHSRPTTSIDTTPASATAPYAFSAASLTPHIASPSLPRRRRGSMRDSMRDSLQGLFSGAPKTNGEREDRMSRRDSVSSVDDLDVEPDMEVEQDRRIRRSGRYFAS